MYACIALRRFIPSLFVLLRPKVSGYFLEVFFISAAKEVMINEQIRAKEVRVIDSDGSQLGILSVKDALEIAYGKDLDLVEISPNSEPPVCRVMDYGKYRFEREKKEKEAKKFANATTHKKPVAYKFDKKEKKADVTKEGVIEAIFNFLVENGYENCEILNKSKLIGFKIAEDSYELDLKRKRKPKN